MAKPLSEINAEFEIMRNKTDSVSIRMPQDKYAEISQPITPKYTLPRSEPSAQKFTLPQPDPVNIENSPPQFETMVSNYSPPIPERVTPKYSFPQPDPVKPKNMIPQPETIAAKYIQPQSDPLVPKYEQQRPDAIIPKYTQPQPDLKVPEYALQQPDWVIPKYALPQPETVIQKHTLPQAEQMELKYKLPQIDPAVPKHIFPQNDKIMFPQYDKDMFPLNDTPASKNTQPQTSQIPEPRVSSVFDTVKPKFSSIQIWPAEQNYTAASESAYNRQTSIPQQQIQSNTPEYYSNVSNHSQMPELQPNNYVSMQELRPHIDADVPSPQEWGGDLLLMSEEPMKNPDTDIGERLRKAVKRSQHAQERKPVNKKKQVRATTISNSLLDAVKPSKNIKSKKAEKKEAVNKEVEKKAKSSVKTILADILFYGALLTMLISAVFWVRGSDRPFFIFDTFTMMNVLTSSMQDTIPKGSLIIVKHVDTQTLNVGDDITFYETDTTTITHRIINIFHDYDNSGKTVFQTKGTNNKRADDFVVYEENVLGKVIYHIPRLGGIISFLPNLITDPKNLIMVGLVFLSIMVFSFSLRGLFSSFKEEKAVPKKHSKKKKGGSAYKERYNT